MSKNNLHKKMTYEDKFDRHFACWVQNERSAWHFWKHKTRRDFRHKVKELLQKENNNE